MDQHAPLDGTQREVSVAETVRRAVLNSNGAIASGTYGCVQNGRRVRGTSVVRCSEVLQWDAIRGEKRRLQPRLPYPYGRPSTSKSNLLPRQELIDNVASMDSILWNRVEVCSPRFEIRIACLQIS